MESKYEKLKREIRILYSKTGSVACPSLNNEEIFFSKEGFNHLIRKGGIVRSIKEQMRRFKLVAVAPEIIKSEKVSIFHEQRQTKEVINRNGRKLKIKRIADFWRIETVENGQLITIIIRRIGNGKKHFFSIMNKKTKKSP